MNSAFFKERVMHSTALSDLILATATLIFVAPLILTRSVYARIAALCFTAVALAASLGVVYWQFNQDIESIYKLASAVAGRVAMPVLAISLVALARAKFDFYFTLILSCIGLFIVFNYVIDFKLYRTLIGALAMATILGLGIYMLKFKMLAAVALILGSLLTIVAGLLIGTKGELMGLLRVDLFHYALAMANFALGWAAFSLSRS